ncbi:MAG: tRNA (adenosine(37)-N6)-threonylcarbamoyltransferase complex ATPase subunit type 1 TsaE [SAR324 cluster bacterium]|nr:tRNA (adenosine(37)-N6)-threonylcarbamoyltransferase complex ATPase subunit type 1 TsaE [SAR324 cluster bacterium]
MFSIELRSLDDTSALGQLLGDHLMPGVVVLLYGNLGSGKTTLTKSICAALGVDADIVTSPTYTLVHIYSGKWTIHHVDLYRLSSPDDLDNFDREDLICDEGLTLVEWPELLQTILTSEPQLLIQLQMLENEKRMMGIQGLHHPFDSLFDALAHYEHTRT